MPNTTPTIAPLYGGYTNTTQTQQAHPDNLAADRPADPRASQLTLGPVSASKPRPTLARLRDVLTDLGVHGICRLVAFELLTYWEPGGIVFPSVKTLAEGIGVDPRIVRRHVARLERIGLWVRVGRNGRSNRYELQLPGSEVKPKRPLLTTDPTIPPPGSYDPPEVTKEVTSTKRRARETCESCGNDWPLDTGRTAINADRPGSQTRLSGRRHPTRRRATTGASATARSVTPSNGATMTLASTATGRARRGNRDRRRTEKGSRMMESYCDRCGDAGVVSRTQIGLQPVVQRCSCYLVNPVVQARHQELISRKTKRKPQDDRRWDRRLD